MRVSLGPNLPVWARYATRDQLSNSLGYPAGRYIAPSSAEGEPIASFQYQALNTSGEEVQGTLDASDEAAVIVKVKAMGLFPIRAYRLGGRFARWQTGLGNDEDLVRFPCEGCGKLVGADPTMAVVTCGRCGLKLPVPPRRAAELAQARAVRLVAVERPRGELLRLGLGLAAVAAPLVGLVAIAACGVVLYARWVR